MNEDELQTIKARNEKAQAEVSALCKGKHWLMTIPADRNRDSDLIIAAALADSRALLAEVQRLRAALLQTALMKTIRGARVIVADALDNAAQPLATIEAVPMEEEEQEG